MKLTRRFILLGVLVIIGIALLTLPSSKPRIELSYQGIETTFSISDLVGVSEFDYACLTSFQYDNPYVERAFQCFDCEISDQDQLILEKGYSPDRILVMIKNGKALRFHEIYLVGNERSVYTSYRSKSYYPERTVGSQCTQEPDAVAACTDFLGKCLFVFDRER